MSMNDARRVPEGRLSRFARLAAMGARSGASMLLDRNGGGAEHAAEVLGTLRGLAAKVGQMASYVDGVVPEAQRDAYEATMKKLCAAAPKSSAVAIRTLIEEELAAPIDAHFAHFSNEPLASASIGQVHAAVLHDGREVAVKVQHPGIGRAVESDLANAGVLEGFVSVLGGKRFDTKAMLEVVRERFREELDYSLEAERLRAFQRIHAGDDFIRIPNVIDSCSKRRVLTTDLARGKTFDEACAASEGDRRAYAETMWRFVFKGTLIGGMLNADPHPGNYIFHDGGRVTFLDYGCIQRVDETRRPYAHRIHRAAVARDEKSFGLGVRDMVGAKPGRLGDAAVAYTRECFKPLFESPFRITRTYAASLVEQMKEMGVLARKVADDELFTMPPEMLFVNRLQFGFYSVLARLDVDVDYARVERGFLPAA